jgi:mRNA-degrading endonuclease toxin of MazEF toxin-antitoxin module
MKGKKRLMVAKSTGPQVWDIWVVKQQQARKQTTPAQPNDPSEYNRMYVVVAPVYGAVAICCPIQNSEKGVYLTDVELKQNYDSCITKDCKVVCNNIFTLPHTFFDKKVGYLKVAEQEKVKTALIQVFDLIYP